MFASSSSPPVASGEVNRRPQNGMYLLNNKHPFRETHWERIRSKQVLPVVTTNIPKLLDTLPSGKSSMKDQAALFYLTLFCPVEPVTGLFYAIWSDVPDHLVKEPNWFTFISLLRHLARPQRTYSEKRILQCILNMNSGLRVNSRKKQAFTIMNFKGTMEWDELASYDRNMQEDRRKQRESNPMSVPPEYAYKARAEDKFDHNLERGGIRSDEPEETADDVRRFTDALLMRSYDQSMANDRRKIRVVAQEKLDNTLIQKMEEIYEGYSSHVKANICNNPSYRDTVENEFDWKARVITCKEFKKEDIVKIQALYLAEIPERTTDSDDDDRQDVSSFAHLKGDSLLETGDEPAEGFGGIPPTEDVPNEEQEEIINTYYKRARARINHAIDPVNHPPPKGQLLMYLDCGPGAGKTWLTQELFRRTNLYAKRVGYKKITKSTAFFPTATTGAACVTLKHECMTPHKAFVLPRPTKGQDDNVRVTKLKRNSEVVLKDKLGITSNAEPCPTALLIDETFMMVTPQLGNIEERMREVTGVKEDFGGVDVGLGGDAMQFSGVGENLYDGAMLGLLPYEAKRPPPGSPKEIGRTLFRKFKRVASLKKLPRSEQCESLREVIRLLSDRSVKYPITESFLLNNLKELSIEDLIRDPKFLESFITVGTNQERFCLSTPHTKAFACNKLLPVMRWRKRISGKFGANIRDNPVMLESLFGENSEHSKELHQYFVEDISAIISINKNTQRGIVNGAEVKLFGLWYKNPEDQEIYESLRTATAVGEICTLPKPPDYVLVEVPLDAAIDWEKVKSSNMFITSLYY